MHLLQFQHVNDIFETYPEAIVHPVSCIGVCHDALSKRIKKIWPEYFREYTRDCIRKKLVVSQANAIQIDSLFGTKFIVTLPIRHFWQENLNPASLRESLISLIKICQEKGISNCAIPYIQEVPENWLEQELTKTLDSESVVCLNKVYLENVEQPI